MRAIATSCYVSSKSLGSHITKGTYNEHFSYIKKGQKHAKKRCGFSSSLTRIFAFSLRRCSSKKHVNLTVETKRCNEKSTLYRLHLSAHSFSLFKTRHLQIQNQENKFCKRQSIKLSQPSKQSSQGVSEVGKLGDITDQRKKNFVGGSQLKLSYSSEYSHV